MPEQDHDATMAQLQQLAAVVQERDDPGTDAATAAAAPAAAATVADQMANQNPSV